VISVTYRIFQRLIVVLLVSILSIFSVANRLNAQIAQTITISSSPNPVGSGARALGMGGAFIGVADDATAASWNPAGLIQLETPEVSVVGAYSHRTEDTSYTAFPKASGPQSVSDFELNYFSLAWPFNFLNWNMIVSLNYQHLYDFNKKVGFSYTDKPSTGPPLTLNNSIDYRQEGGLRAISPAFAVQITPEISFGFTLNFWEDMFQDNGWKSAYDSTGTGTFAGFPFTVATSIREKYEMSGFNYNAGIFWNMNHMFSMGAVFKSPFSARLKHDYNAVSSVTFLTAPGSNTYSQINYTEDQTLDMPMSYGLGLSARLSDALTLGIDVYRTQWEDYALHRADGTAVNPITGKIQSQSDVCATTQVRLGGEYLIIGEKTIVPIRAGLFYDPEPSEKNPEDFWGISFGTGIAYKKIVYDVAYQYRFGRNVRTTTVGNEPSHQDVDQHSVYMSVIYHF
jgi:long-subunit fatty acid transport protein